MSIEELKCGGEFYSQFLLLEKTNCYWFWYKGRFKIHRDHTKTQLKQWSSIRLQEGFEYCLNILIEKYMSENGQTKSEFNKNLKRVQDIVEKSNGNIDKATTLTKTQANRITDEWKSINRAMCAKELFDNTNNDVYMTIFEIFFQRAYELGSVSKQEYRQYKLDKLGL
jgi:hypothetical protein